MKITKPLFYFLNYETSFSYFQQNHITHFKAKIGSIYLSKNNLEYTIHDIKGGRAKYTVKHPSGNITTSSSELIFFEDLKEIGTVSQLTQKTANQENLNTIFFPVI